MRCVRYGPIMSDNGGLLVDRIQTMASLNSMRTGMHCEIVLCGKLWLVAVSAGGPEHI